jgi:hypothetical protein
MHFTPSSLTVSLSWVQIFSSALCSEIRTCLRLLHKADIVQQLVELENYNWLFHRSIHRVFAHKGSNSPLPGFEKWELELEKSINFISLLNECSTTKSIDFKIITF